MTAAVERSRTRDVMLNADRCRSKAAGEAAISHPAVICWLYQATAGLGGSIRLVQDLPLQAGCHDGNE